MIEHDEIDTVRREFGALAGKVRDAGVTAARWNTARTQQAERARERSERSHDRSVGRAERAIRLAERGQRYLHAQWQAADRAAAADLAVDLQAARASRSEQEDLVAQWAWAQAHADENPQAAQEFDARLRAETGIDPAALRNPFAENSPSQRTQPFTPFDVAATTEATEPPHHEPQAVITGDDASGPTVEDTDLTALDGDALIRGLIQAAHPVTESDGPGLSEPDSRGTRASEQLSQGLSAADAGVGE